MEADTIGRYLLSIVSIIGTYCYSIVSIVFIFEVLYHYNQYLLSIPSISNTNDSVNSIKSIVLSILWIVPTVTAHY